MKSSTKFTLAFFLLAGCCSLAYSQNQARPRPKFISLLQAAYMPGIGTAYTYGADKVANNRQTLSLRYTGSIPVGDHWQLGAGLGYEVADPNKDRILNKFKFVPLLASFRYCFDNFNKGLSIYADPGLGLGLNDDLFTGFSLQTGAAYRYPLGEKIALQGTAGYSIQNVSDTDVHINSIIIGLGLVF